MESELVIKTDHKWKNLLYFCDLTEEEKKELDWIQEDTAPVFRYRGSVYSLDEFERTDNLFPKPWQGFLNHTYSSGIVVEIMDAEQYRVGYWFTKTVLD